MIDRVAQERLDPPGERELGSHDGFRGERKHLDLAAVAGHPPRGVTALGERDEVLRPDPVGHLGSGLGDDTTTGLWLPVDRRHVVQLVALGRADDPRHRAHGLDGVLPHAGLTREHHRVRAVENGVGDVRGLGPGGGRVGDHRLQHLGGHDHWLRVATGLLDHPLLQERHVLERALHAEVPAGHHEPVEGLDHLVEVVDGLRLLDLRDHGEQHALLVHDLPDVLDVPGRADERERDEVDAQVQTPAKVLDVLLRHGRNTDRHTGEVDALVVADPAAGDHLGVHLCVVLRRHPQADLAIIDQDLVARGDIAGQSRIRRIDFVVT